MARRVVLDSHVFSWEAREQGKRSALEMEKEWRENSGAFMELKTK
jgi:hypothetical protein